MLDADWLIMGCFTDANGSSRRVMRRRSTRLLPSFASRPAMFSIHYACHTYDYTDTDNEYTLAAY